MMELPSKYQIGAEVAVLVNPEATDIATEFTSEVVFGVVIAVKFTKSKVFYTILDDYDASVITDKDSALVVDRKNIEILDNEKDEE
jgi:hypothetical protein